MPTGYTADIEKGISFEKFALGCARAFGALISMREEDSDAQIPEKFEPSDYHLLEIEKAKVKLKEVENLTIKDAKVKAQEEYDSCVKSNLEFNAKKLELKEKYEVMLQKAKEWIPPTEEHIELKKFMIEQIEKSIEWDCLLYDRTPYLQDAEEWLKEEKERAVKNVSYHEKQYKEEVERCNQRTEWVNKLRNSF